MRNQYLLQCPSFAYCPPSTKKYEIFVADSIDYSLEYPPTMCPRGTGTDQINGK